jgi:hypothetical protein
MKLRNEAGAATEMDERDWTLLAVDPVGRLDLLHRRRDMGAAAAAVTVGPWRQTSGEPGGLDAFLCDGGLNNVIPFSLIVCGQARIASGVASMLT